MGQEEQLSQDIEAYRLLKRQRDKEKKREQSRIYYANNREKRIKQIRAWQSRNAERFKEMQKQYRNSERGKEKQAEWRRKYYLINQGRICQRCSKYYQDRHGKVGEKIK